MVVHIATRSVQGSLSYPEGVILAAILDGGEDFMEFERLSSIFVIKAIKLSSSARYYSFSTN